jgi:DNA-binding transcriptional LysR family regulator
VERHELLRDPVHVVLPADHPVARRHRHAVPLAELAGEAWTTGHGGMGWEEMTERTCRELGGFDPDIRHRANDATIGLALVARGLAVTLLPDLPLPPRHPGIALRAIADAAISRAIFAATRATDAARPSTQALLAAVRDVAADLPYA